MDEGRSREGWVAGLTLAAGGVFLTLAGPPGPAVWWGLSWSIINGLVLVTRTFFRSRRGQFFLLGVNLVLAGSWLFVGGGPGTSFFPFLLLLPLLVPLYLGQKQVVAAGLVMVLFLGLCWYIKAGLPLNSHSLALWGGWIALAGFCFRAWLKILTEALKVSSLQAEVDHWRREYKRSRSQLAAVELMAVTDGLTGVFNYRYFEQSLERLLSPQHQLRSLAVLMVDIDHFKEINDSYGHLVGNRVLTEIAAILKEHTREQDVVTRFGGEEFAIILPGTDYRGALQVAERIRRAVAEHTFNRGGPPVHLTISTGMAVWPEDGVHKEELVSRADLALYQAKTTGRNSVCPYRLLKADSGP
ncbi:GGDEF domain-containing protein [Neomoorella mulderi]|uniref:Response regulator PleD n=1 Tax=Moorella mulderi DSM 14980 TaxID=1122241 RepID=A0A151AV63_9FIRM|nr:sensor domain-containing diguanylate cyclase [Moorella mulderi]KYH31440.1 response regulator PleD [Moorella mulderi DSM 14980]